MNKAAGVALVALALLVFAVFGTLVASHAATDGLCCADDAAISLVAKSLARGEGYALPLNFSGESGRFVLDAGISTGPTVVLPAAASLLLAGAQPWAPSLASAVLSLGLLFLLALGIARRESPAQAAWFLLVATPLLFLVTSGEYFVHWYALLGEATAWGLLGLAAWTAAGVEADGSADAWQRALAAGLLAGLAVDAKLLALLGAAALGLLYLLRVLRGQRKAVRDGLAYAAGCATAPLAFEAYRLAVLGLGGYRAWLVQMKAFMAYQGPAVPLSHLERAASNFAGLQSAMALGLPALALPLLLLVALRWHAPDSRRAATAAVLAILAAGTNLAWWLLASNGWPRYALIGLALVALAAALTVVALRGPARLLVLLAAFACLVPWHRLDRPKYNLEFARTHGFSSHPRLDALRAVAATIDRPELREAKVAGYWWATLAPLEYASAGNGRTVGFNRLPALSPPPAQVLLLEHPDWDRMANAQADESFTAFKRRCTELVLDAPPYLLRRCR